jgi:hypothetical protein
VSGCEDDAAVLVRIEAALASVHAAAHGRPLAVRLTLAGATPLHARLVARKQQFQADAQSVGFAIAGDCWVEQLRIASRSPVRPQPLAAEPDGLDLDALLDQASRQPAFDDKLAELMRAVAEKLPRDLRAEMPAEDRQFRDRIKESARDYLLGSLGGTGEAKP